jgi:hypothetical protein
MGRSAPLTAAKRQRHNALKRHHGPDAPVVAEAARDLKLAHAEDYIRELVDQAPPLSAETRSKLAVLLLSGRTPDDSEAA